MKLLITGSNGFIGKNLVAQLNNLSENQLYLYDIDSDINSLDKYCQDCDFVFHLAGVNRSENEKDFMLGNFGFTSTLLDSLKKHKNKAPILITSSIQAGLTNPYGLSKKAGEELIFEYGTKENVKTFVYRLPNVFGKWCRPNYNSVVATFCHNIANKLPIKINDPTTKLNLVYIDDVIKEFTKALNNEANQIEKFCYVPDSYEITLGVLAKTIYSFEKSRENLTIPDMKNLLTKKLYSTYLSYLPEDSFSYPLKMHVDNRGSFTEFIKTKNNGQVSVNISKPGITKGNHWHHTKNEKFLVVQGKGVIRFRNIYSNKVIEYNVSSDKLEVVDIPVGYTHNIENLGDTEMITIMWANEVFDPANPDTYFLEV